MTAPTTENLERLSVTPGAPPLNEGLPASDPQLRNFAETLCALSDQWPSACSVSLRWEKHRDVLVTDGALATYRAIYGNDLLRGLRHIWASARRQWRGEPRSGSRESFHLDASLPPDAVVIPQRSYPKGILYVFTVVSAYEQRVVKIFSNERRSRFENELNAWRLAQTAGIGHRVPEVIATGESMNGFCWLATRLVRNSAVNLPVLGDCLWRRYLRRHLLPDLQRFYEQSGIEVLTGCAWLARFRAETAGHAMSAPLQKLADLAETAQQSATDAQIASALVHGDLRPHNVHRHGGQWWLIDWSMSRRAPLLVDLWPRPSKALASPSFSAWLRGESKLNSMSRRLRGPLDLYAAWQVSWLGIKLDSDALRFHVLATLLHRLSYRQWPERSLGHLTFRALGIQESDPQSPQNRRC
jgi:Phosphotransferase enzyme family